LAKVYFLTDAGIAQYPHIVEPDTEGQYATGKHTTKLVMSPEKAAPLIKQIDAMAEDHKVGKKNCKLPYKDDTRKDGDTVVKTGNIRFTMSSKFAPALIDPRNKPIKIKKLNDDFDIGAGSRIRVAGEIYPYDKGLSLQMSQVQILDLVSGRQSRFDAQDGSFDGSEYTDDDDGDTTQGSFTESNKEALGI
jgi:hypothetical protein